MATPFVQGRLRDEVMSFDVETECACCGEAIRFTISSDLSFVLADECTKASPVFYVPMVDFTRLEAPSIVDAF